MAQQPPVAQQQQQPINHYSPASVDGVDSQRLAKQVSSAYSDVYYRTKQRNNTAVEHLQYLPPDQPQDDLWSGSLIDETFWRANANYVIARKATGLTREQRSTIDTSSPAQPPPVSGMAPVRFFESTKSRSRSGR